MCPPLVSKVRKRGDLVSLPGIPTESGVVSLPSRVQLGGNKKSGRGLPPASCSGISLFCLFSDLIQGMGGGRADRLVIVFQCFYQSGDGGFVFDPTQG